MNENAKALCHRCVGEEFLKAEIKKMGMMTECFYCREVHKCLALDQIADHFERAFEQHFFRTPTEPSSLEYAMDVHWYRSGYPVVDVISETGKISVAIAEDIRELLSERYSDRESYEMQEECEFDEDAHYDSKGVDTFDQMATWRYFENSLKKKSRYFSKMAGDILSGIFEGISGYNTEAGKPVIVEAGPGTALASLYRARVFQSNEKLTARAWAPLAHRLGRPK